MRLSLWWHSSALSSHVSVVNTCAGNQEHRPKKANAVKPDVNGLNMKKGLQTAILHYHPVRPHLCLVLCCAPEHDSVVIIAAQFRVTYPFVLLFKY